MSFQKVRDANDPQRFNKDAHVNIMLFPESWIALSQELTYHKALLDQLEVDRVFKDMVSFSTCIACISTYCNVAVDGDYGPTELDKLFKILVDRLRQKRGMIDGLGKDLIIIGDSKNG